MLTSQGSDNYGSSAYDVRLEIRIFVTIISPQCTVSGCIKLVTYSRHVDKLVTEIEGSDSDIFILVCLVVCV